MKKKKYKYKKLVSKDGHVRTESVRSARRYLGSWVLPSGNSCDVYLPDVLPNQGEMMLTGLSCEWDEPPSPQWPHADVEHWKTVTFPEILRAVATATGQKILGVTS
jgi:hypothetical protein